MANFQLSAAYMSENCVRSCAERVGWARQEHRSAVLHRNGHGSVVHSMCRGGLKALCLLANSMMPVYKKLFSFVCQSVQASVEVRDSGASCTVIWMPGLRQFPQTGMHAARTPVYWPVASP